MERKKKKRQSAKRQKCKICLATKNGEGLERNFFAICEMICDGNLRLKIGVSPTAHT